MKGFARETIQNLFTATHPIVGDHSTCATGEPYVSYGIICPTGEAAEEMLVNTFRVLAENCAPRISEGSPMVVNQSRKRYLLLASTTDDLPKQGWRLRCPARLLVRLLPSCSQ